MLAAEPNASQPALMSGPGAWVLWGNTALLTFGGLIALVTLLRLWPRRGVAQPLAGITPRPAGPAGLEALLLQLAIVIGVYAFGAALLHQAAGVGGAPVSIGSHAWHLLQLNDAVAKLAAAGLMLALLRHDRVFVRPRIPLGWTRSTWVVIATTLSATAVCLAQLAVFSKLWEWTGGAPMLHNALSALRATEWGVWGRVQLILSGVVVAAVAEELLFRGVLLQGLWRLTGRAWPAVIVSSVLFGLIHYPLPMAVVPLVSLGVILAVVRIKTGSLTLCIVIHGLFNARSFVIALTAPADAV